MSTEACWRSECRTGCYYPDVCSVRDLVYRYNPEPVRPTLKGGVTVAHQVIWSGRPGPGMMRPVALLVDEDGNVVVEPTGEWQDTNIVDDTAP